MDPEQTQPLSPPAKVRRWHAARALRAGVGALIVTVPGSTLVGRLLDIHWSGDWWITTGALFAQAAITAGVLAVWRFRDPRHIQSGQRAPVVDHHRHAHIRAYR